MSINDEMARQREVQAAEEYQDRLRATNATLRVTVAELTAERDGLEAELDVANRNRASLREALGDATTHLEIEQREHEETKGYRHHAESERDALRAVVRRLVGAMNRWGAEGDGVPDASFYADPHYGTAYDDAVAMLELHDESLRAALGGK